MKKSLLCFATFLTVSATSAFADPITEKLGISGEFLGTYALVDKSGKAAADCAERVIVLASPDGVTLSDASTPDVPNEWFRSSESGCKSSEGDIGPVRTRCTNFSKSEVSFTDTSLITIVGMVRQYQGIRLGFFDSDMLTWEHDSTEIPFGILGLWDHEKFKCTYKRVK